MAILTQNDLDIYAEAYGTTPWEKEGMTFAPWAAKFLAGKDSLPKVFSLAAKKTSKLLSAVNYKDPTIKQGPLQMPMKAIQAYKKKLAGKAMDGVPLLSSYAVRTV